MSAPAPGRRRARTTLATCCGAHVLHDGLSDLTYVLLPLIAEAFGLRYAEVGLVRAAHRSAMSIFQLPAGLLAERVDPRGLLAAGTLLSGAAMLGLGRAEGLAVLLATLFAAGLGSAVQHPLSASLIAGAYASGGRRAAIGTYNFAGDVGKLAFTGGTSALLAAGLSWRAPVTAFGAVGVAGAAVLFLALRSVGAAGAGDGSGDGAGDGAGRGAGPRAARRGGWGVRSPAGVAALCAITVLDGSVRVAVLTFTAFLLIERGLDEALATVAVPALLVGGMLGKLACGFLAERLGVIRTLVVTELGTAVGIGAVLALPPGAAFVVLPVLGVALSGTSSVVYGSLAELVDAERHARAYGALYSLQAGAGIAAPLVFGLLADRLGMGAAIGIAVVLVLAVLPLCLPLAPALAAAARRAGGA